MLIKRVAQELIGPKRTLILPDVLCKSFKRMAGTTGLEPAASAVTGQRSNQLNYVPTRQINEMRNRQCLCGFARIAYIAQFAAADPDCIQSGRNR